MNGTERRSAIVEALSEADGPLPGTALAAKFGVSRQVIVQDVALIRSNGTDVVSTRRGYILGASGARPSRPCRLFKVRHDPSQTAEELNAIVDLGGTVENVMVNHRAYGRMEAPLGVRSRRDAQRFIDEMASGVSSLLMTITDGYHFHLVSADSPEVLDEVEAALRGLGFLAPCTEYELQTFEGVASE